MTDPGHSLSRLLERAEPRGPEAVLGGARRSVHRYRQRRQAAVGVAAVGVVMASTLGSALLLRGDDNGGDHPDLVSQGPGQQPSAPEGPLVTDVRLEGHPGFDRIVVELNVDRLDHGSPAPSSESSPSDDPECMAPSGLDSAIDHAGEVVDYTDSGSVGEGLAAYDTPDGLPPGLGDQRITGDTTYIEAVIPLCIDSNGGFNYALDDKEGVPGYNETPLASDTVSRACELANPARLVVDFWDLSLGSPPDISCPEQ